MTIVTSDRIAFYNYYIITHSGAFNSKSDI